jgi:hypothetical protein
MSAVAAPADSRLGKEYRLPRYYFWLGIVCTAFFLVMGVGSIWVALANPDGSFRHPEVAAAIFAVFWGLFTLLGVFLVRAYLVERLVVWEDRVRVVGSVRTREARFAEVTRAVWRVFSHPGGSIVLYGPGGKAVIYFGNYGGHGAGLREFFRRAIPEAVQERWERHAELNGPPPPEKVEKARRARKWVYGFLAVSGAGLLAVGLWDPFGDPVMRWQNLIFGSLSLAFGAYCLARPGRRPATGGSADG